MKYDPTMLNIGREKQLLVDDLVVQSVENICRSWHRPTKVGQAPLIEQDRPWEHILYTNCSDHKVIYDPEVDLFKCWYSDWQTRPGRRPLEQIIWSMLYAQSTDGIHWEKPLLGRHKRDGRDTNIVLPDAHALGILLDTSERDPSKRFKIIFTMLQPKSDVWDIVEATSPDGIDWTVLNERPVIGRHGAKLDDVIILDYDPYGRLYVMNTRHYDMYAVSRNLNNPTVGSFTLPYYPEDWRRMNKRRIWQAESSDMLHWSEPYVVMSPTEDAADLDETYYGLCQFTAGSLRLGLMTTFHYVANTQRVLLVYSRDGKNWHHLNKGQSFLESSGEGAWDSCSVTATSKPIVVGDEMYIYYGGASCHHDWWITGTQEGIKVPEARDLSLARFGLGLAKLRLDGFASLDTGKERPGIFTTRPVISDGTELVVNARCRGEGSVRAEIADVQDNVIAGFSREECDVFAGDSVRHTFSWRGQARIPVNSTERAMYPEPERERFRKIRFFMENAELYSFSIE